MDQGISDQSGPFRVHRASAVPLYRQVEEDLRKRIEAGTLPAGMKLPSEAELSGLYDASRITIRQALRNLASSGLVSRQPGRGTYVRRVQTRSRERRITSLVAEMRELGFEVDTRVLVHDTTVNTDDVPSRLGIRQGERVHRVNRLRLADGIPFVYQVSRLPVSRFPDFEHVDVSGSLYAQLRDLYGVVPLEADETISVGSMDEESPEAREAMGDMHSSVLVVERITFDDDGPIEWGRSLIDSSRYQLRLGLKNTSPP